MKITILSALALFGATGLSAQAFAGTIEARFEKDSVPAQFANWSVRGDQRQVMLNDTDERSVVFRFLVDAKTGAVREASFTKGARTGDPALAAAQPATVPVVLTPLDKHRKVADTECIDHTFDAAGRALTGCFASTLGGFSAPAVQHPVQMKDGKKIWSLGLPAWAIALDGSALFPIKVWDAKGKTLMEVKDIRPNVLLSCFFTLPRDIALSSAGGPVVTRVTYSAQGVSKAELDAMMAQQMRQVQSMKMNTSCEENH